MPQFEIEFTVKLVIQMSDNVLCSVVVVEVPLCGTVFKFTPRFPVTVVFSFFEHTLQHENPLCGSP